MMEKQDIRKFCLDRVEEGIAVCLTQDTPEETALHFSLALNPSLASLHDGTLFTAQIKDGGILEAVTPLSEETEAAKKSADDRLAALFARKKHR